MTVSPAPSLPPRLPPQATSPSSQPAFFFAVKTDLLVGALVGTVGVVAGIAICRHLHKTSEGFRSRVSLARQIWNVLSPREIIAISAIRGTGAVVLLVACISFFYLLIKISSAVSLGIRVVRQMPHSTIALLGVTTLAGATIFTCFFKITISSNPFRISITRHKTTPPSRSTPSSKPITLGDAKKTPTRPSTIEIVPKVQIVKVSQDTPAIANLPPAEGALSFLPLDILAKEVFPKILEGQPNFNMFHALALVSKSFRGCLYSPKCLVPERKSHFLSKAFLENRFNRKDINAFFNKYLPPKDQYQGEGLLFSWGDIWDVTLKELTYLADRFPNGSFGDLELLLTENDDVQQAGSALSLFLSQGKIERLDISHDKKVAAIPSQPSEKLIQFLQQMEGKVTSLVLWGGWEDPSQCHSAMQKLKVANLYFLDARGGCSPKGESFQGEELQKLSIMQVRDGGMVTKILKKAPHLKDLSITQESYRKIERDDDPLRGLSLEGVRLERLKIEACQSNIQKEGLEILLKQQSQLKDLHLRLPNFALLPTTFIGLPIEKLFFVCENTSFDEAPLAEALASIKSTLRSLVLGKMDFRGFCLQGLQLEELYLAEIGQLQEDALHQALKGRHWKILVLRDVNITGACLKDLEVEELWLDGNIPHLNENQLYKTVLDMKNRGLKKLNIYCYRGSGGVHSDEDGFREYNQRHYYLRTFKDLLGCKKEFAGLEIHHTPAT